MKLKFNVSFFMWKIHEKIMQIITKKCFLFFYDLFHVKNFYNKLLYSFPETLRDSKDKNITRSLIRFLDMYII